MLIRLSADQIECWGGRDAAFAGLLVTTVKRVITTRVGSNGITTIMMYSKMPFENAFDALMTLRASIERF